MSHPLQENNNSRNNNKTNDNKLCQKFWSSVDVQKWKHTVFILPGRKDIKIMSQRDGT